MARVSQDEEAVGRRPGKAHGAGKAAGFGVLPRRRARRTAAGARRWTGGERRLMSEKERECGLSRVLRPDSTYLYSIRLVRGPPIVTNG